MSIFLGHHKCATTWIHAILQDAANHLGLKFEIVSNASAFNHDLPAYLAGNQIDILSYSNAKIEYVRPLTHFRAFHVIRDPRDILVSAYHSHLHSHATASWPQLASHRERLASVSKDEGLRIEMGFSAWELEDLAAWDYALPNVIEMKMEDLIVNPYDRLLEAFEFLGLVENQSLSASREWLAASSKLLRVGTRGALPPVSKQTRLSVPGFLNIVYNNRFAAKAGGRQPGTEDVYSHYRKGVAGDWVNHFSPENRALFKTNFGGLLQKLGYEPSNNW
ncbi:MAG: sulfotransferase domain-containing protein [Anaerolineales bacterium]